MKETHVQNTELEDLIDRLEARLAAFGIPIDQWGNGEAKTVRHLATEIQQGECTVRIEGSRLVREAFGVRVEVRYIQDGVELELVEVRQVFMDGRNRARNFANVGEKTKPGELPEIAAQRALEEELGITTSYSFTHQGLSHTSGDSLSYPGLYSKYTANSFRVYLQEADFKQEGYVEVQPDKSTYFEWKPVRSSRVEEEC